MFPWSAYAGARACGARTVIILHKDPRQGSATHVPRPSGAVARVRRFVSRFRAPGRLTDLTICVSRTMQESLVRDLHYAPRKTIAVPNGVDLNYYRRRGERSAELVDRLKIGGADPLLVCVARLVPPKAIDVLVKAMAVIGRRRPECRCLIIGDGSLEAELRALAAELGVDRTVTFVGRTDDVRPYLELADIFVLSSKWEGLPLSLLEAMAYGLPCVATDLAGNREVVAHGDTGLIVKSGSPEALAEAVLSLAEDTKERDRMAVNARKRVEEHFDIEAAMTRIKAALFPGERPSPTR